MNLIWFESWQRVGRTVARAAMLLALLGAAIGQGAWGQVTVIQRGTAPAGGGASELQACNQGHPRYIGPLSAETRVMTEDPYVWFVSPEFASRLCMPASFIDPELKGALAIAAGMVPVPQFRSCRRTGTNQVSCSVPSHLMLDIYIDNQKIKLPKLNPDIEFYSGWQVTSADVFTFRSWRADQRRTGVVPDVPGEIRPFAGSNLPVQRSPVHFWLLGVRGGWASSGGTLLEAFYRANWLPGIDLIRLSVGDRYGGMENPATKEVHPRDSEKDQPIQRWAIGAILEKDQPQQGGFDPNNWKIIPYPSGYLHTIELPLNLAQIIYEYDKKSGTAFFDEMQQRFERATGSTAPVFRPPASK